MKRNERYFPRYIPLIPYNTFALISLISLHFLVPFVRTIMDRYQLQEMKTRDEEGKLNGVFDSLNFLGTTCWKINTKLLGIMIDMFNDKGDKNLEIFGPDFPPLPKINAK